MTTVSMKKALATLALAALAGCAVGPDFKQPAAPATDAYTAQPLPATLPGNAPGNAPGNTQIDPAQRFVTGQDIAGDWWTLFHNPALNDLITLALRNNKDLAAAQAALRQARENVYAQEGSYVPSLSGNFTRSRNKTATGSLSPATASGNPYYTLNTAQLTVSYNPDVFGLNQRQVESLVAQSNAQRYQLEATYLTLTSNLVSAVVIQAAVRGQIEATQEIIRLDRGALDIFKRQLALGGIAGVDVLSQQAALAQAEAPLPPLQKQLAQQQDLITALTGHLPNQVPPANVSLDELKLPTELPVSLPSKLVEQRPDIRQATEALHSASALIGVAVANRLPLLNLSAFGGSQSLRFNDLFSPSNAFWTLAASVTQPIFDGGTLLHRERGARAAFDQAAAQYQGTVITAFQSVADALQALKADSDAVQTALTAEQTADAALKITQAQLKLGQITYLQVLTAQQTSLQAKLTLVQARAARLTDTAALFQAMGGGWWNRSDVAVRDSEGKDILGVVGIH